MLTHGSERKEAKLSDRAKRVEKLNLRDSSVLASVAFDAGIISPEFYTTLVLAAVLTSQSAGAWLDYELRHPSTFVSDHPAF